MSEQERIILQYLENSYTGARMLDDTSAMTRIARAIEAFEADPTEDIFAVEPKKGKWIRETGQYYQVLRCDQCGHVMVEQVRNYCPNCGARMTEESE